MARDLSVWPCRLYGCDGVAVTGVGDGLLDRETVVVLAVAVPVGEVQSVASSGGDQGPGAVVEVPPGAVALDVAGDHDVVADGVGV